MLKIQMLKKSFFFNKDFIRSKKVFKGSLSLKFENFSKKIFQLSVANKFFNFELRVTGFVRYYVNQDLCSIQKKVTIKGLFFKNHFKLV